VRALGLRRDAAGDVPAFLRCLGLALSYPDPGLLEARPQIGEALRTAAPRKARRAIEPFAAAWPGLPAAELVRTYVATFDLNRRSTLYLTYYLHGDRRQRGMAFLRLKRFYEASGWELTTRELPDFLPLMLEFAGCAPAEVGLALLAEHLPALELLRLGLRAQRSLFAPALDALLAALPALGTEEREVVGRLLAEGPPKEQVGLEPYPVGGPPA
jgi:nitrate reductase delta subunit